MLCEKCGKNIATTHIKTNINGIVESHHLCSKCAANSSYSHPQTQLGLSELLGSLFGESLKSEPEIDKRRRCPGCGMCFDDIAESGRVGCDKCYETFLDQLLPSLQRMHGKALHSGKIPKSVVSAEMKDAESTPKDKEDTAESETRLNKLKELLKAAIDEENFEEAVTLRDEIKAIQEEQDHE